MSDQAPGRDSSEGPGASDEAPGRQDGAPGSSGQSSQGPGDSGEGGQGADRVRRGPPALRDHARLTKRRSTKANEL